MTEGKVATQLGYIVSGQLRYYSISSDGEEHTTYVSIERNFVTSLLSYLKEIPAIESIRAISTTQLWFIEKANVERLIQDIPKFKDFYIKVIEYQICCIDQSRLELITLTAEQRYTRVLRENPDLLQKVPLQYLASILGVTPRHLSRIRKSAL